MQDVTGILSQNRRGFGQAPGEKRSAGRVGNAANDFRTWVVAIDHIRQGALRLKGHGAEDFGAGRVIQGKIRRESLYRLRCVAYEYIATSTTGIAVTGCMENMRQNLVDEGYHAFVGRRYFRHRCLFHLFRTKGI
jgi:hypothetical protein